MGGRRWWLQPDFRRPSSDRRVSYRDDVVLCRGGLGVAHELRRAVDGRQLARRHRIDGALVCHRLLADWPCEALQPEVLSIAGVEVLLPQPRGGRVRRILADGLGVVAAEDRVARHEALPGGDVLAVRGAELVPDEAG